jgi:hypothetical protein
VPGLRVVPVERVDAAESVGEMALSELGRQVVPGVMFLAGFRPGNCHLRLNTASAMTRARLFLDRLEPRELPSASANWTPLAAGHQYYVTGPDRDLPPVINIYDAGTGQVVDSFLAYSSDFRGGVQVALGDINGDGIPDIVTAPEAGGGPNIRAFSGKDGSQLLNFFAYEPSFRGGASVAVADLDGNGRDDLIVGAGVGGGPRVRVFLGSDLTVLRDFFAYEPSFRGGVNVAGGDVGGGTGKAIVAGAGIGGGPVVKVFRYSDLALTSSFFAYDPSVRGGVFVAAGDLDGDDRADIVTGPGTDAPNVRVFDAESGKEKLSFMSGQATVGGVRVGVILQQGNADPRIVTGNGPGAPAAVRLYLRLDGNANQPDSPGDPNNWNGTFVGG